jgi:hypothetical protein
VRDDELLTVPTHAVVGRPDPAVMKHAGGQMTTPCTSSLTGALAIDSSQDN